MRSCPHRHLPPSPRRLRRTGSGARGAAAQQARPDCPAGAPPAPAAVPRDEGREGRGAKDFSSLSCCLPQCVSATFLEFNL